MKRCIVIRETDIEDPTSLRSADAGEVTGTGSHTAEEVLALVDDAMLGEEHVAMQMKSIQHFGTFVEVIPSTLGCRPLVCAYP